MKQDSPTTTTTTCGHCGFADRKILHHVRHRGNFRRLCTTCVLRLHPQWFCPSCFTVYDRSPPEHAVVCYKCYSNSHRTCVSPPVAGPTPSSRAPSPCATCLNPSGLVFDPKTTDVSNTCHRAIDIAAARLLLAASEISFMSMNKAAAAAYTEAERRAKEASYTKKRAREALDHIVYLMENEKKKRIDSNGVVIGNGNNKFMAVPAMDVPTNNSKGVAPNDVSEAMNAVDLKEDNAIEVFSPNKEIGLKNESVLLSGQEKSLNKNRGMPENTSLQRLNPTVTKQ